jgi:hypothetical protein
MALECVRASTQGLFFAISEDIFQVVYPKVIDFVCNNVPHGRKLFGTTLHSAFLVLASQKLIA